MYDVVIIGAGVTGCAVARELSRYQLRACVLERCEDVCCGTSKANSAIVHAGFDAKHGSKMAELNVRGSRLMPELCRELDVPYRRNGSLVVCMDEADLPKLHELYENGLKNGVEQLEIIGAEALRTLEPNISPNAVGALCAPTGGIVCPFTLTIALAENAYANGVAFRFNTEVAALHRENGLWHIQTNRGEVVSRCVVNAAGVYADTLHNLVSETKLHITPRRGEYMLLDRTAGAHVSHTVFQLPGKLGKGVLVSPTIHGNLIVGPTAEDIFDREGTNTTANGLHELAEKAQLAVSGLPLRQVITSFAGLRAHEDGHEFVLGEADGAPGFFDCAGIESPGLSASPAIGQYTAELLREKLNLAEKPGFIPTREGVPDPKSLSPEEYRALIARQPAYGQIVCRCEQITEGEILDAIRRPLGAKSVDGVKRRTRAGMGRCQAGFCSVRVMELLSRELGISMDAVTKCGGDSRYITGKLKEG